MKNNMLIILLLVLASFKTTGGDEKVSYTGPMAIIYKTKADYSKNVPVTLSEDKTHVVSYPAPQDVFFNGNLAYPTKLAHEYWLDNRGVNANSAFIKLTYEEYSRLPSAPGPDELYKMIIDKDPFVAMYNLGNRHRFSDIEHDINHLIEKHKLKEFKRIK